MPSFFARFFALVGAHTLTSGGQFSGHSPPVAETLIPDAWADGAPRSWSVLVEVAGLPGGTKSETSGLTAMWDFELRE